MASSNRGVVVRRSLGRWRHLILGLWLAACGGVVGQRTAGGESHFLRQCADDCGAGLECVSGVCTRGCLVGEDKCTDLAAEAECTDASIEPGALAVCDVGCESDLDCRSLGSAFECQNDFCRGAVLPGQSSGGGSAGSSSVGGGPPIAPACTTNRDCEPTASCVDLPDDGCSPITGDGCPGRCLRLYSAPECSGAAEEELQHLVGGTPCPDGMECVVHDPNLGLIPPGICVESSGPTCTTVGLTDECPEGFACVQPGPCVPVAVDCHSGPLCKVAAPPDCSYGYARSFVDGCFGPCVPVDRCACSNDDECTGGAVCTGDTCAQQLPWQPPNECELPFDAGTCDANFRVYAMMDGACQEARYGGCEGNANRFRTMEQCLAVCAGSPIPNPCPAGRTQQIGCIACGDLGCGEWATVCVETCETSEGCSDPTHTCQDGLCSLICEG